MSSITELHQTTNAAPTHEQAEPGSWAGRDQWTAPRPGRRVSTVQMMRARQRSGVSGEDVLEVLEGRAPVQRRGAGGQPGVAREVAAEGFQGAPQAFPHGGAIQQSFGRHGAAIAQAPAWVGGSAAAAGDAMGAVAYVAGGKTAFTQTPDLFTAAHEAAHVVQQRHGVSLDGGVSRPGDRYERHADAVADKVTRGESAEGLLDQVARGNPSGGAVQARSGPVQALFGSSAPNPESWKNKKFKEIPRKYRNCWVQLGWSEYRWESHDAPPSDSKPWDKLTKSERAAASTLGYKAATWNSKPGVTPLAPSEVPEQFRKHAEYKAWFRTLLSKPTHELLTMYFDPKLAGKKLGVQHALEKRYPPSLVAALLKDPRAKKLTPAQIQTWEDFAHKGMGQAMTAMLTSARRLHQSQLARQKHINSDTVASIGMKMTRLFSGTKPLAEKDISTLNKALGSYQAASPRDALARFEAFKRFIRAHKAFMQRYETYFIRLEGKASQQANTCRTIRNVSAEIVATIATGGVTSAVAAAPAVARLGLTARTLLLTATAIGVDKGTQAAKRAITGQGVPVTGHFQPGALIKAFKQLLAQFKARGQANQKDKKGGAAVPDAVANRFGPGTQAELSLGGTMPLFNRANIKVDLGGAGGASLSVTASGTISAQMSLGGAVMLSAGSSASKASGSAEFGYTRTGVVEVGAVTDVPAAFGYLLKQIAFALARNATTWLVGANPVLAGIGMKMVERALLGQLKKHLQVDAAASLPKRAVQIDQGAFQASASGQLGGTGAGSRASVGASGGLTHFNRSMQRDGVKGDSTELNWNLGAGVEYLTGLGPVSLEASATGQYIFRDLNWDNNGDYQDWTFSLELPLRHFKPGGRAANNKAIDAQLAGIRKGWGELSKLKNKSGELYTRLIGQARTHSERIQANLKRLLASAERRDAAARASDKMNFKWYKQRKKVFNLLQKERYQGMVTKLDKLVEGSRGKIEGELRKNADALDKMAADNQFTLGISYNRYSTEVGGEYRLMYERGQAQLSYTNANLIKESGAGKKRGKKRVKRGGGSGGTNVGVTVNLGERIGTGLLNYVKQRFMRDVHGGVIDATPNVADPAQKNLQRTPDWARFVRSNRAQLQEIFENIERERAAHQANPKPTSPAVFAGFYDVGQAYAGKPANFDKALKRLEAHFVKELGLRRDAALHKDAIAIDKHLAKGDKAAARALVNRHKGDRRAQLATVAAGLRMDAAKAFIESPK